MVVMACNQLALDAEERTIVSWNSNRYLRTVPGESKLRWSDVPNDGGSTASITTGVLTAGDNHQVLTIWRQSDMTVHMMSNANAEFAPQVSNDSTGTGGTMTLGPPTGGGETFIAIISTWSSDPGADVRLRARNKTMILTGLA